MADFFALPDAFERVPNDFDGPVFYEVAPEWRSGRGRWWRPNSSGYTDHPAYAGIYAGPAGVLGSERSYAVSAQQVLACMDTVYACATKDLRAELAAWTQPKTPGVLRG